MKTSTSIKAITAEQFVKNLKNHKSQKELEKILRYFKSGKATMEREMCF